MQPNTPPAVLKTLRQELDYYRIRGKRAVFPEALKQKVVALSGEYSTTVITQTLGLSSSSFQRWRQQYSCSADVASEPSVLSDKPMFVSLPDSASVSESAPATIVHEEQRFTFSITLCCDTPTREVSFQGRITLTEWANLLKAISQELLS